MIAFYGQGGLGNQLFQYAAARRLALNHDCAAVLDPYWFGSPLPGETPRPLELTRYAVVMRVASEVEQRRWKWMRGRLARHVRPLHPLHLVREQGFGVQKTALTAPRNIYLMGFWQSEAYFSDIRSHLIRELTPIAPPAPADQAVIELIGKGTAVSVHIRRGDYVTLQSASAFHGLCSLDYYRAAIQHMAERVENPVLFVFSDDPAWTRANLSSPFPTHYVNHNRSVDAFQDLRLMSLCRHHIIANSSFSWWGAWLAEQQGVVVAPARWYAADRPTPDLLPPHWARIAA